MSNPFRSLSRTLVFDVVAKLVTRTSSGPIERQAQSVKIPEDATFQQTLVHVSDTKFFEISQGYTSVLFITSPYSFIVELEKDGNVISQTCKGMYCAPGNFDGKITLKGLEEDPTRCSVVTA